MSEIDRGASESSKCKESKLPKIIMVALVVAVLFASSLSLLTDSSSEIPPASVPARAAYTSHAPISIDGNAGFTGPNATTGVVWGSGTVSDPYIIEGWDINASSANGILIQGTTAYFIIRNCYVYDGGLNHNGISLHNCVHGTVTDNIYTNNCDGIYLSLSSDNTLSNNNCSDNIIVGIRFYTSSNNTLSNNTCSDNWMKGMDLRSSSNNTLSYNNCSSNGWEGVFLWSSSNSNIISWNEVWNNTLQGVYIHSGSNNRIWNNTFINNNGAGSVYDASHIQAREQETNDRWNSSGTPHGYGNYWSDWTTPDNSPPWGIVDNPYNIWGNSGTKDYYPLSFPPDNLAPITNASLSGTAGINGWFKSDVSVSLSAADAGSGVNVTHYRIGTSGSWLNYSSSFILSSEGISTVQFYSMDNASNNETVKSIVIKIDTMIPESWIQLSGTVGNDGWFTSDVLINLTATDIHSGISHSYWSLDLITTFFDYSEPFYFAIEGNHSIGYWSIDSAGNMEIPHKYVQFKIDKTLPTLTFVSVNENYTILSWNGSDETSGIDHFEVKIDGGSYVSIGTAMSYNFTALADGTHNVTVKAVDKAGNEVNKTIQFTVDTSVSGILILYGAIVAIIILAIIAVIVILMKKNKKKPLC